MEGWRALIRLATVTKEGTDDQAIPVQQVAAMGKTAKPVPVAMPYGLHANVPAGTPGILWRILGQRENRFFTPLSWRLRRKESPVGDVVFFQPQNPTTEIILRANGDIEIKSATKITLDAPAVEYTGTLTSTSTSVELRDHKHAQPNDGGGDAEADVLAPKN